MFLLRLFHRSDPAQPIAAHMLGEGVTRVGRDPAVDWVVPDPECEMSRHHLDLVYENGTLAVRALGANGVIDCATGKRLPDEESVAMALGDAVEFGPYRMVVDSVPFATQAGASFERTMVFSGPLGGHRAIPTDWADAVETEQTSEEGSLLEAFCEGAGLDVSALSGEEPDEIMRRAGAIYRQMVLGLGELVNERSAARAARDMDRTTIGAQDNNPFKWAPGRRLATDLLLGRQAGFLTGPDAIRASFEDVRNHLHGVVAGCTAAIRALIGRLDPIQVEGRVEGKSAILKGRGAMCWDAYRKLHGELAQEAAEGPQGAVGQAFTVGYEEWIGQAGESRTP